MSDLNDLPLQQILVNNFNAILDKNEKNLYHIEQLQIHIYPGMRWEFINLNILGNGIVSLITLLFNTLSTQNRQTLFQNSQLLSLIPKESFTEDDALLFLQKNYSHIVFGNISIKKSDTIQAKVNLRDELYILHGLKTGEFEIGTEDFEFIDKSFNHLEGLFEPMISDLEEWGYQLKHEGKDYFHEIEKKSTSLEIEEKIIRLIKQNSSIELIEKELHNFKISILQEANNLIKFNDKNK